jgi:hypothetical protein
VSGNTRKWPVHEPAQVTQPIAQDVHSLLVAGQIIDSGLGYFEHLPVCRPGRIRSIPCGPSTVPSLLLETLLHPEHHQVDVQRPRIPAPALRCRRLGFAKKPRHFFLIQAELTHSLFRRQIRVPAVQSPAEELIKRMDWAFGADPAK